WSTSEEDILPLRRVSVAELSSMRECSTQDSGTQLSGMSTSPLPSRIHSANGKVSVEEVSPDTDESDTDKHIAPKSTGKSCKEDDDVRKNGDDSDNDEGDSGKRKGDAENGTNNSVRGKHLSGEGAGNPNEDSQPRWKGKGKATSATILNVHTLPCGPRW
ncbi:hypothetical protein NX059_007222, partial [Plenodomus lindquistii]